jgi:AmmeMemoRadiSam system protein A
MLFHLGPGERRVLLQAARDAINSALSCIKIKPEGSLNIPDTLKQPCGAFVTLTKFGDLRGCIGYVEAQTPLYQTVVTAAKSAAFRDTRFDPVTSDEMKDIQVEISVLKPPSPIESWKDIKLGRHGIILSKRGRRALFLPHVATEQGWDLPSTLTHLAMKAGLAPDEWREGASYEVFEAEVFGEADTGAAPE